MTVDEKIIAEIKKKNREAFKDLFYRYYSDLTRYAEGFVFGRSESEDIVQNLFVYIWEHADRMDIRSSLDSYLYRCVRNRCYNYLRGLRLTDRHRILHFEAMLTMDHSEGDEDNLEVYIQFALSRLPERMAEIFELKYLKGKKYKEIAERMNISENTVKTQLLRAKTKLREVLSQAPSLDLLL